MKRRDFLTRLSIMLSCFVGFLIAIPVIGSLIAPFLVEKPRKWRDVGSVEKFNVGDTVLVTFKDAEDLAWAGTTAETAAWLRRESQNEFIAFSINCTHLGCPVRWESDAELFMCPCHGGVYYKDGTVWGGPPPKQLQRYPVRINKRKVEIKTSPVPVTNI